MRCISGHLTSNLVAFKIRIPTRNFKSLMIIPKKSNLENISLMKRFLPLISIDDKWDALSGRAGCLCLQELGSSDFFCCNFDRARARPSGFWCDTVKKEARLNEIFCLGVSGATCWWYQMIWTQEFSPKTQPKTKLFRYAKINHSEKSVT